MTNASTIWRTHAASDATPAQNYERFFVPSIGRPLAVDLVDEAALRPGERVIDVACGTGIVARLAAERLGDTGTVAGVDINPGMLAVARVTAAAGGPRIRWYKTSAESIPLPDETFDVAFCQVSLQFIEDKVAALREMRRVLVPGGRTFVNVPRPTPFFDVLDDALSRHAGEAAGRFVGAVFSLGEPDRVERPLRDAGFRDVSAHTETKTLRLPPAEDFVWQYVHSTPLSALVTELDDARARAIERDVVEGWRPWSDDDGMTYDQDIIVASARR